MADVIRRLLNELPTIAIAVWAILNAFGINIGENEQTSIIAGVESLGGLAIWLLVRRNTDGPVTALKRSDSPGTPGEIHA